MTLSSRSISSKIDQKATSDIIDLIKREPVIVKALVKASQSYDTQNKLISIAWL